MNILPNLILIHKYNDFYIQLFFSRNSPTHLPDLVAHIKKYRILPDFETKDLSFLQPIHTQNFHPPYDKPLSTICYCRVNLHLTRYPRVQVHLVSSKTPLYLHQYVTSRVFTGIQERLGKIKEARKDVGDTTTVGVDTSDGPRPSGPPWRVSTGPLGVVRHTPPVEPWRQRAKDDVVR